MVNVVLEGESGSDRLVEQLLDARSCRAGVLGEQRFAHQLADRKRTRRALGERSISAGILIFTTLLFITYPLCLGEVRSMPCPWRSFGGMPRAPGAKAEPGGAQLAVMSRDALGEVMTQPDRRQANKKFMICTAWDANRTPIPRGKRRRTLRLNSPASA